MPAYRHWQDPGIKVYAGGKPTMDLVDRFLVGNSGRLIAQTASPDVLETIYNSMEDGTAAVVILPERFSQNPTAGRLQRKGVGMEYVPPDIEAQMSPPHHSGLWHDVVSREDSAVYSPAHKPGEPSAVTFEIVNPDYARNIFDNNAMLVKGLRRDKQKYGNWIPIEMVVTYSSINRRSKEIFKTPGEVFVYFWMGRVVHISDRKNDIPRKIKLSTEDGCDIEVDSEVSSGISVIQVSGPPVEEEVPVDRYAGIFASG